MRMKSVVLTAALTATLALVLGSVTPAASALPIIHTVAARQVSPDWVNSATVYEVNVRQFSEAGNFDAVKAALPRIFINGGRRGYLIGMVPAVLVEELKAMLVDCALREE